MRYTDDKKFSGKVHFEQNASGLGQTIEDLAFGVDYNDVGAAEITHGTTFWRQSEIDDFLTSEGATNFKYLQEVFDTIPTTINHTITINLAAGVHRPKPGGPTYAWELLDRVYGPDGGVEIYGDPSYTDIVGAQSITGYSNANWDPYIDFAPATFPNDGSLIGYFAILSTGQISVIHDHTDSRLYIVDDLSPDPTGGTTRVAEPATVMRNSYNDVDTVSPWGTIIYTAPYGSPTGNRFHDLKGEPFESSFFASIGAQTAWERCVLDQLTVLYDGKGWVSYEASLSLGWCSRIATVPADYRPDEAFYGTNYNSSIYGSVIMGGDWGIGISNAILYFSYSVAIGVGKVTRPEGSINLANGASLISYMNVPGKQSEIRGAACAGIWYRSGSKQVDAYYQGMLFRDCTGPCIRIGDGVSASFTLQINATQAYIDGGGNTDVGVQPDGSGSSFHGDQYFTVAGAAGDIRLSDGTIVPYTDIEADGPAIDSALNVVRKDP